MKIDAVPMWNILHRSFARYLNLTPQGLRFPNGALHSTVIARILHMHPTRTLYQERKPCCRSLDGVRPLHTDRATVCVECRLRDRCTVQLNLQLTVDLVPYNLLISFTSLKNFLFFKDQLERPLDSCDVTLGVRDRGRWGELTFACTAGSSSGASQK